jgi:hypothetical protein
MEWNDPAFRMRGRTSQEIKEAFKDDMVIYIMKTLLESLFGGLWILVLVSIAFGVKDILRITFFGFKDPKESRTFSYLRGAGDRMRVVGFFVIVLVITAVMLRDEQGRRVMSYGTVSFLFGFACYHLFYSGAIYNKKGLEAEIEGYQHHQWTENRNDSKDDDPLNDNSTSPTDQIERKVEDEEEESLEDTKSTVKKRQKKKKSKKL